MRKSSRTSATAVQTFIQKSRAVSSEEKAIFHNETGAGRSRVKRVFFALTPEDEEAIVARIERGMGDAIDRAGAGQ